MIELVELSRDLHLDRVVTIVVLVLARVAPIVVLAPFLGGSIISAAIRTIVTIALGLAVYPAAAATALQLELNAPFLVILMLKEAMVGTALGLLAAVAFHTLTMVGQLIDQTRGASNNQVLDPFSGDEQSPLSLMYLQLGIVLFLVIGGHRAFLAAIAGSYSVIPLTTLPIAPPGLQATAILMSQLMGGALAAAVLLAAPAFTAIMLTDLALGLLGRAAPQLGTYFMAMPLRAAVGLFVTLLAVTLGVKEFLPQLGQLGSFLVRALQLLQTSA